tara:strand:+ start:9353 stop:9916 length:564 start_codon:yes stop_codon:yes gene_type:complete
MGTKRIGLARVQALIENLKREVQLGAGTELLGLRKNVIALDNASAAVARVLTASESNSLVTLSVTSDTGSRGIAVTMPTPTIGLQFDFVIADPGDGTNDITIKTATDAVNFRGVYQSVKDGVEGSVFDSSTIVFDVSDVGTPAHLIGTSFSVVADGSHWYVIGGLNYGGEDASGTGFEPAAGTDADD